MAGYTLLLAVTACLLVRFVGVWDDVRTVLLLVVLMFLATSVTFDEVLARSPGRGVACYLGGLLFAVAVSEAMLRGIHLGLPALFRVPYYLALALFFLYPVALTPLLDDPGGEALPWALFGFTPAAGLVCMSLLPAVHRGRAYVRDNGSPWPWAWYPWTLFGVLAFGVVTRSAMLCWSMHHVGGAGSEPYLFGFYFLVPFLLPVGVLVLELGRVEGSKGALRTALFFPPLLLILASVGHRHEAVYEGFLTQFTTFFGGTPLYLTLLASVGFYGYAALKRSRDGDRGACGLAGGAGGRRAGDARPWRPGLAAADADPGGGRPATGARAASARILAHPGRGVLPGGRLHDRTGRRTGVPTTADRIPPDPGRDPGHRGGLRRPPGASGCGSSERRWSCCACLFAVTGSLKGSEAVPTWALALYPPIMAALIAG
jgi:hypothetical protein